MRLIQLCVSGRFWEVRDDANVASRFHIVGNNNTRDLPYVEAQVTTLSPQGDLAILPSTMIDKTVLRIVFDFVSVLFDGRAAFC